jgi:hypothetical protein
MNSEYYMAPNFRRQCSNGCEVKTYLQADLGNSKWRGEITRTRLSSIQRAESGGFRLAAAGVCVSHAVGLMIVSMAVMDGLRGGRAVLLAVRAYPF